MANTTRLFDWGVLRDCPSCGRRLMADHENFYAISAWQRVGDQRVKVKVPSTYCKKCDNEKRAERRRWKRKIDGEPPERRQQYRDMLRGPCDCCGRRQDDRTRILGGALCRDCLARVKACNGDVAIAKVQWKAAFTHKATELAKDKAWDRTCDRRRRPGYERARDTYEEEHWRMVMRWLQAAA